MPLSSSAALSPFSSWGVPPLPAVGGGGGVFDRCAGCETTPLYVSFLKGVSPGGVLFWRERTTARLSTHTFIRVLFLWTECSQQTRGRKEGREGGRVRGKGEMNSLRLKELSNSDLYRRRQERPDSYGSLAGDSLRWVCLCEANYFWDFTEKCWFNPTITSAYAGNLPLLCCRYSAHHLYLSQPQFVADSVHFFLLKSSF